MKREREADHPRATGVAQFDGADCAGRYRIRVDDNVVRIAEPSRREDGGIGEVERRARQVAAVADGQRDGVFVHTARQGVAFDDLVEDLGAVAAWEVDTNFLSAALLASFVQQGDQEIDLAAREGDRWKLPRQWLRGADDNRVRECLHGW